MDSNIDIPEGAVEAKIDEMVNYYEQNIAQYGMDFNSYLQMTGKTLEQFRDEVANEALESVQGDILFVEIGKAENISTDDEEVDKEIELYKAYYGMDEETFEKFKAEKRGDIITDILRRKTANLLLESNN